MCSRLLKVKKNACLRAQLYMKVGHIHVQRVAQRERELQHKFNELETSLAASVSLYMYACMSVCMYICMHVSLYANLCIKAVFASRLYVCM